MADEQLLILKMLEDGKISAEQATELLSLVGRGVPARDAASREDEQRRLHRERREEARQARLQSRLLREEERRVRRQIRAEAKLREAAGRLGDGQKSDLLGSVQKSLQMLGLPLGGNKGFVFTKELHGQFGTTQPEIQVQNSNGRISIGRSPDERWHLNLTVRVRADSAGEAKERAENLVRVKHAAAMLSVESQRFFGQNAVVDVDLLLPDAAQTLLTVSCTNGTVNLADLTGERVVLHTTNGRINAQGFDTYQFEAHSVNGGIDLSGCSRQIKCHVVNGRLQVRFTGQSPAKLDLETVSGTIEACLPRGEQIGYQVSAVSTAGGVEVNLPDMRLQEERRPGRRRVEAESRDLGAKPLVQAVQAKTVSGKIRVYAEGGPEGNV